MDLLRQIRCNRIIKWQDQRFNKRIVLLTRVMISLKPNLFVTVVIIIITIFITTKISGHTLISNTPHSNKITTCKEINVS